MTDHPDQPVDFAAYARRRNHQQAEADQARADAVHRAWAQAITTRGASLADPAVAAAALGLADMLDRLVKGALLIRTGGPDRTPDPGNGIDEIGAQLVHDLMSDLRSAVAAAQKPDEE